MDVMRPISGRRTAGFRVSPPSLEFAATVKTLLFRFRRSWARNILHCTSGNTIINQFGTIWDDNLQLYQSAEGNSRREPVCEQT